MAYRYGDRKQKTLFPQSIDEYIPQDAPTRAYDIFVDSLDFEQLGIRIEPDKVGCPQYDPKIMLKLLFTLLRNQYFYMKTLKQCFRGLTLILVLRI